jgi:hypothetical protein
VLTNTPRGVQVTNLKGVTCHYCRRSGHYAIGSWSRKSKNNDFAWSKSCNYTANVDSKVTKPIADKRNAILLVSLRKRCNPHQLGREGDILSIRPGENLSGRGRGGGVITHAAPRECGTDAEKLLVKSVWRKTGTGYYDSAVGETRKLEYAEHTRWRKVLFSQITA